MKNTKLLVSLVAVFALALISVAGVNASFATIGDVRVSDVSTSSIAANAGDVLPVQVVFNALSDATDVRVKAWLAGGSDFSASTDRFDVIAGNMYTKTLYIKVPSNIDPSEEFTLYVTIEDQNGIADGRTVTVTAQRSSYNAAFLNVDMASQVKAGDNLALDVVLKNKGSHLAEDTFVKASIPALGIVSQSSYFGDLSAVDQTNLENGKQDAGEKMLYLQIPSSVQPGIYDVVVELYNSDSQQTISKKVAVVGGARENTNLVSAVKSQTLAVGQEGVYSLTLVNSGSKIMVYQLSADSADKALSVSVDNSNVVVPAGSSQTVTVRALANEAGQYSFTVKANAGSEVASQADFAVKVSGSQGITSGNNAAVLLTVVLAVIFVVLLVVLIVLLTRKPQKTEEFGESYY